MDKFSYIKEDTDIYALSYAKSNSPFSPCTWHEGGIDYIFRYYNKPNKRIAIDAGSNYGFFSIGFAQHFSQVHSFEINPNVYFHLEKNIALYKNITPYNYGLSNEEKLVKLKNTSSSGTVCIDNINGTIDSKVKTLDSLNIQDVDFIKIDVEGHEYEVFKGSQETITKFKPVLMFEWWSNRSTDDEEKRQWVFNFLYNLNYKFVDHRHHDFIFIPQ